MGTRDNRLLNVVLPTALAGTFHLVAVVDQAIAREVASECTMLVGAGMPLERMAELLNALAWPDSIAQGQTQRSSIQGQALWQGDGALPKALKQVQQGTPIPVLSDTALPNPLTLAGCAILFWAVKTRTAAATITRSLDEHKKRIGRTGPTQGVSCASFVKSMISP